MNEITLRPIGVVCNGITFGEKGINWALVKSRIEIDPLYEAGLTGLKGFSHIYVLFWMSSDQVRLRVHPRGDPDFEEVGVFASRSPTRPNPIGLTLVRLEEVKGNILTVKGLDAYDGSPVLDIKPFMMKKFPSGVQFPDWA
ncbi:MAG: tRNA (N6-threonylcarbamoyladenosine(37)-N6)-methyltransferase TrmO [Coprothermobacterota bacterium]|nr:tRNA (N6-threonylcarbamoyladenosine(37)-N6)-methyltransferase TrmO [Caldisericota bacterium]MDI6868140.1 tRNA (N6-threonylcarbamoyladenosine(37)-N6)-methyltransferase TrmO [Coprothermobacterota bacterium]